MNFEELSRSILRSGQCLGENVFQLGGLHLNLKRAVTCHGDVACLLAHYDADGIRDLTQAQGRTVTQAEALRDIHVMAYGKYAPHGHNAVGGDYHGTVMEGGVLEEDIFDQAHIDVGIDYVAGFLIVGQGHLALHAYQCAGLGFRHGDAGIYYGHDLGVDLVIIIVITMKQPAQMPPSAVGAYVDQEALDLILKDDDKHYETYAHELVEDCARQAHIQYLGRDDPDHDKEQDTIKQAQGAAALHHTVYVVEQHPDEQDVKDIFYSELKHGAIGFMGEILLSGLVSLNESVDDFDHLPGFGHIVHTHYVGSVEQGGRIECNSARKSHRGSDVQRFPYH